MPYTFHTALGQSKTLVASGTMALAFKKTHTDYLGYPEGGLAVSEATRWCYSETSASLGPIEIRAETFRTVTIATGGARSYNYGVRVYLNGNPYEFIFQQYISAVPGTGGALDVDPRSVDFTTTLSWEIAIDARLQYDWTTTTNAMGSTQPHYEGNESLNIKWIGDSAGDVVMSCTIDDTTIDAVQSATRTISGAIGLLRCSGLGSNVQEEKIIARAQSFSLAPAGYDSALNYAITSEVAWSYSNAELSSGPSYTWTELGATQTVAYTVASTSHSANRAASGASSGAYSAASVAPARGVSLILDAYALTGRIRDGGSDSDPDVLIAQVGTIPSPDVTLVATDGHLAHSFTQRWEQVYNPTTNTVNQLLTTPYGAFTAKIPSTWMTTARGYSNSSVGADPSFGSWFHLKSERIANALTINIATENALPSGTDTAISGGVRRTYSTKIGLTTYRYLSVAVGSAISGAGKVRIIRDASPPVGLGTSYEWTSDRDGNPITGSGPFVIDLLCPSNRAVEIDATASTYPEDSGIRRGEGWLTGPSCVDRLEVTGTTAIGDVKLVRHATDRNATLSCVDQCGGWANSIMTGGSVLYKRAFMGLTVDGRVEALSETDAQLTLTGAPAATPASLSIADMLGDLNHARNRGISATTTLITDAALWQSDQLPSVGLAGAGWLWKASTQEWESTIDKLVALGLPPVIIPEEPVPPTLDTITLDYQLGVRSLVFPANLGDLFGHAGDSTTTGVTQVVGYSMIHSQAIGVVLADPGAPEDPVSVGVRTRSGFGITFPQERGLGNSAAILGEFATGTDWMRGNMVLHDAYTEEGSVAIFAAPRRRHPVRFVSPDSIPGVEAVNPRTGWFGVATSEARQIRWRRWQYPVPFGEAADQDALITSGYNDRQPCLLTRFDGRTLLAFWSRGRAGGDGIYEMWSENEGDTWSTPAMSIPSGQYPRSCADIGGGILRAAYVPDTGGVGVIKGTWQSPGDASPSSVFTFQMSTGGDLRVKKTGFALSPARDGASRLNLVCTAESETATSNWYSEDDGHTWTLG